MNTNATNPFLPEILNSSTDSSENSLYNRNVDHIVNGKEGKMFVGGLSWMSSVESLHAYFERFGEIEECVIMRDAKTKMTRGFGFVTFIDSTNVEKVLTIEDHFLDGKKIDPQIAIRHISPARSVNNICRKVFIGGVPQTCDVDDIKDYFSQFGLVEDAVLKMDYPKKQHRGFGFITFVEAEIADLVCTIRFHSIQGKPIECKKAQKKEFVKLNGEAYAAASHIINNMSHDQLLALYGMVMNGMYASNVPSHQQSEPVFHHHQQPLSMSPPSVDDDLDSHMADFRRRLVLKYLSPAVPVNQNKKQPDALI